MLPYFNNLIHSFPLEKQAHYRSSTYRKGWLLRHPQIVENVETYYLDTFYFFLLITIHLMIPLLQISTKTPYFPCYTTIR